MALLPVTVAAPAETEIREPFAHQQPAASGSIHIEFPGRAMISLQDTDARVTPLEEAFSSSLGQIWRQLRDFLIPGTGILAALLLLPGVAIVLRISSVNAEISVSSIWIRKCPRSLRRSALPTPHVI